MSMMRRSLSAWVFLALAACGGGGGGSSSGGGGGGITAPAVSLSPTSLSFGNQTVNTTPRHMPRQRRAPARSRPTRTAPFQ